MHRAVPLIFGVQVQTFKNCGLNQKVFSSYFKAPLCAWLQDSLNTLKPPDGTALQYAVYDIRVHTTTKVYIVYNNIQINLLEASFHNIFGLFSLAKKYEKKKKFPTLVNKLPQILDVVCTYCFIFLAFGLFANDNE